MQLPTFAALFLTVSVALAAPSASKLPLPSKQVYQFPVGTWIENVAARSNGNLLLNLFNTPSLYSLNPNAQNPTPELVHVFTNHTTLLGITETKSDVFILVAANVTNLVGVISSSAIWKVDFNFKPTKISKVVDIPTAQVLNGVVYFGGSEVLVAESSQGLIYKVNYMKGTYTVALDIPELDPPANATLHLGVNGIHIFKGYLYWTNSEKQTIYRGKLNSANSGSLLQGSVATVARVDTLLDDFAIDGNGIIWACTNAGNTLIAVNSNGGQVKTMLGSIGEFTVAGDTSTIFGRTKKDLGILYVVTDGGLAGPVNGTGVEGGKVVAVDTRGFSF